MKNKFEYDDDDYTFDEEGDAAEGLKEKKENKQRSKHRNFVRGKKIDALEFTPRRENY